MSIATSPVIRNILNDSPNLINLLSSIDALRGHEREQALQRALGVTASDISNQFRHVDLSEDMLALRQFAEAVEAAIRGDNKGALGLNWDTGDENQLSGMVSY
jgi:zinc finger HIT domain-containing protein 3